MNSETALRQKIKNSQLSIYCNDFSMSQGTRGGPVDIRHDKPRGGGGAWI